MAEALPSGRRIAYALGNPGFQLTERIIVGISIYFYLPPGSSDLASQVPTTIFLGGLTAYGLASIVGRIFDSAADPFVGHASDQSRSRLGRRRVFMLLGLGPMIAIPVLVFYPPGPPGSSVNAVWLTVLLGLYFVFYTMYVAPYLALIPELAWDQASRIRLATLLALLSFPVLGVFGFAWPLGLDWGRAAGLDGTTSIRMVVWVTTLAAIPLCLGPILAVDEKRYARNERSELPFREAVQRTLVNRPFLLYLLAQLLFILGINLIQPALPYYAVVVFGRSEGFAAGLGGALGLSVMVCFPLVRRLTERIGPKRAMVLCVTWFGLSQLPLGLVQPDVPGGPHDAVNLILGFGAMVAAGFPIAGFLILPHVLISQLIDRDQAESGFNRAAMFFGMQGFMTKWMFGVSGALLAYLFARFGNSPDEPLGVVLVGPIVGVCSLVSAALYALYPEREVLAAGRTPS